MATNKNTKTKATTPKQESNPVEMHVESKKITAKDIDLHQFITVYNGFQGKLIYKSQRTGETFEWSDFGTDQEIELIELKNAKSTHKKYFEYNWFMFDEDWVVDFLGVKQFYKNAIKIDDFDNIFTLSPAEIKSKINVLSDGQKESVAYRAKVLIAEEKIDSNKAISALEEALGVELIER